MLKLGGKKFFRPKKAKKKEVPLDAVIIPRVEGMRIYKVYTDGSVRIRFGAWCAIIVDDEGNEKVLSQCAWDTTIGKMELAPILAAFQYIKDPACIIVHSDSEYAINSVSKWLSLWAKVGWTNLRGEPVKNLEILTKILPFTKKHDVRMQWVKGHNGHPENERCDMIARSLTQRMKLGKIKPPKIKDT